MFGVLSVAWLVGGLLVAVTLMFLINFSGLVSVDVPIAGSSMLPTFTDGSKAAMYGYRTSIFPQKISRGDIITFENSASDEKLKKENKEPGQFIKRIVATAGDTVEIKNGYLYINGKALDEPYINKVRSTFGGEEIKECQMVVVPDNKIFVLGDNRKRSSDSRNLGFVEVKDIAYYTPTKKQSNYKSPVELNNGNEQKFDSMIDQDQFLSLVNNKRKESGLKELRYQAKLKNSAESRGKIIIKTGDFTVDGDKSGYSMNKAMADANYSNTTYWEVNIVGYYDAQELFDYYWENQKIKTQFLNKDFQEIGIGTMIGEMNGCPVQVVVVHLAGYIPPNYKQEDINSWKTSLDRLKEIQPSWEKMKSWSNYNDQKNEVDRITQIISTRISRIASIYMTMSSNKWLSNEQRKWIEEDSTLYKEQESLATKLNSN